MTHGAKFGLWLKRRGAPAWLQVVGYNVVNWGLLFRTRLAFDLSFPLRRRR